MQRWQMQLLRWGLDKTWSTAYPAPCSHTKRCCLLLRHKPHTGNPSAGLLPAYHYHWELVFSTDKQAMKCARERSNPFSHLGQRCRKEQLLIKKITEVGMISTYKSFSCLIPHQKKREKSHFKLGTEVYADITQIKKAFEMLLLSPDLATSPLRWSTFSAHNFQHFLQLHFPDAKVKWCDQGTSSLWLTTIFEQ